jgi:hypothetical protein
MFSRECELRVQSQEVLDKGLRYNPLEDRIVAAYLHDVLEDTKLSREDLIWLGCTYRQLDIVERLTKPDDGPAPKSYYQGISESDDALVVKCADRCANLDDAFAGLLVDAAVMTPRRWANYVDKTYTDVLPMYPVRILPGLRYQLEWRLQRIELALPDALARRQAYVNEQRRKAGLSVPTDSPQGMLGAEIDDPDHQC